METERRQSGGWLVDRLRHYWQLFKGVWVILAIAVGLIGNADTILGHLPTGIVPSTYTTWHLPNLSPVSTAIIVGLIVVGGILEKSYRLHLRQNGEIEILENQLTVFRSGVPRITKVELGPGRMEDKQFTVLVQVFTGTQATSFEDNWTLDVVTSDGRTVTGLRGSIADHFLPAGQRSTLTVTFPCDNRILNQSAINGATIKRLTVTDSRGLVITYPSYDVAGLIVDTG